jgi:hypothetical protein
VKRSWLDSLNSVSFYGNTPLSRDFVRYYRSGGKELNYDVANGPMLYNVEDFLAGADPVWMGQQTVFFGDLGPMLDEGLQDEE